MAGRTASHDFPTLNAVQPTHPGGPVGETAFVTKLNASGSALLYSTYLGGTYGDVASGIAVDAQGNAYVTGETVGGDFPTTPGVVQTSAPFPLCYGAGLCSDAFVTKFSPTGARIYSTFLAGEGDDTGRAIAVDAAGHAHVVGVTASLYFPIRGAFQPKPGGITDAFVTKLSPDGSRILFSSYLGGGRPATSSSLTEGYDAGGGIALGPNGQVHLAGRTVSANFPATPGAFQTNAGGGDCFLGIEPCGDAFLARIRPDLPGLVPTPHLDVTPAELAPGGIFTATWAGIQPPTSRDRLILFSLGERSDSFMFLPEYQTGGTAAGALSLALPDTLQPGSYELRLLTPNPESPDLLITVARSDPLSVSRRITLVAGLATGNILRVRVNGLQAGIFHIEATESLESPDWRVIATVAVEAGQPAEFSETTGPSRSRRFYRVSQ